MSHATQREIVTVWEFRSVDGKQVVRAVRPAWPDDEVYAHALQRIVYRGPRDSAEYLKAMRS